MTRSDVPQDNFNAMHTHRAAEIFIVTRGKFTVSVGGGHSTTLSPGDFTDVPPGVERCFRCEVADSENWCSELNAACGNIATVIPGESWVQWSQSTIQEARERGAKCNDFGTLQGEDVGDVSTSIVGGPTSVEEVLDVVALTHAEFLANIYRASEPQCVVVPFRNGELRIEVCSVGSVPRECQGSVGAQEAE